MLGRCNIARTSVTDKKSEGGKTRDGMVVIKKYANQQLRITTFNQSRYPRIYKETLLPCPRTAEDDKKHWYPPGHGDLYNALLHSGVLDQLIAEGKEYLFVSNSDNLGAV